VDQDALAYPETLLREWKRAAEESARVENHATAKDSAAPPATSIASLRDLILDTPAARFKKVFDQDDVMRFVCADDVQLAIVVDADGSPFEEPWIRCFPANGLPPTPAEKVAVRITYAAVTLANFSFLWLDGARYLLPLPPAPTDPERIIDEMQAALGRIVGQDRTCTFEDGMKRARIRIVPSHHTSLHEWLR
jgi:hypothetical protein